MPVTEVVAGDIAAVAKLANTRTGDTLAPKGTPVKVAPVDAPPPQYGVAIVPRTQADDDKLGNALAPPAGRGPVARRRPRCEETHQTVLRGAGRHAHRGHHRAARPQVRRQRRHRAAARRLPRDGRRHGRGRGQGEEAERRPRPVRRGEPARRRRCPAARASSSSTPSSAAPSRATTSPPCRRASRRRWPTAACTASRSSTCRSSASTASTTRSTPARWRSRPPRRIGFKEAMATAGVVVLEPVSLLTVTVPAGVPGRRDGRHQRPPRPGAGHRHHRARRAGHRGRSCPPPSSLATPSTCAR